MSQIKELTINGKVLARYELQVTDHGNILFLKIDHCMTLMDETITEKEAEDLYASMIGFKEKKFIDQISFLNV